MLLENLCELWARNLLSLKKFGRNLRFGFRLTGTQGSGDDDERQSVTCFCIAAGRTPYRFPLPPDYRTGSMRTAGHWECKSLMARHTWAWPRDAQRRRSTSHQRSARNSLHWHVARSPRRPPRCAPASCSAALRGSATALLPSASISLARSYANGESVFERTDSKDCSPRPGGPRTITDAQVEEVVKRWNPGPRTAPTGAVA